MTSLPDERPTPAQRLYDWWLWLPRLRRVAIVTEERYEFMGVPMIGMGVEYRWRFVTRPMCEREGCPRRATASTLLGREFCDTHFGEYYTDD